MSRLCRISGRNASFAAKVQSNGGAVIHDLRHSFASGTVTLGEGLPMIDKLLGHTQVQTTARYVHLAAGPVKAAAERIPTAFVS